LTFFRHKLLNSLPSLDDFFFTDFTNVTLAPRTSFLFFSSWKGFAVLQNYWDWIWSLVYSSQAAVTLRKLKVLVANPRHSFNHNYFPAFLSFRRWCRLVWKWPFWGFSFVFVVDILTWVTNAADFVLIIITFVSLHKGFRSKKCLFYPA